MTYKHIKPGWYEKPNGKKIWVRSGWELHYCAYLDWLVSLGEIKSWAYEPDEFEFPVKRGTRFYKPDFRVTNSNDGSIEYHEVKGHWTGKAKTQVKRFRKYYPELKLVVIGEEAYKGIERKSALIPGWE